MKSIYNILKKTAKECVEIRLKNGIIIQGTLEKSNRIGNLYLKNVKIIISNDNVINCYDLVVRGNSVLLITVPKIPNGDLYRL
uniref:mRNA splicing factor snRNP Sm-D n=1 Tax=Amorphochlora amoebiformis TaxID=1561963 RepID=A0A0H5BIN0_9EUKA|nr:mRNA splicing factor snRNP Sm-D [Amorphochlora amoebiformis]|mmetsp:Transcript_14343/g.22767  ORF Transcript_14343/g.22767 Transcript_14343/m.22767 type:complete len:83 (+) Transcript_14343:2-250(+)